MQDGWKFIEIFGKIDDDIIYQASCPWKQKSKMIGHVWIAGIALIILLGFTCIFHTEVKAEFEKFISYIAKILGIEGDISDYSEVQNQTITKNGLSITLQETVLGTSELIVSYLVENNMENSGDITFIKSKVWLDGKRVVSSGYDRVEIEDEEDSYYLLGCHRIDETYLKEDVVNIRILLTPERLDGTSIGEFEYEFTASYEDIMEDTAEVSFMETIKGNGEDLTLKKFTLNGLDSTITGVGNNLKEDWYWLKGMDSLGNPVEYYLRHNLGSNIEFVLDKKASCISPEAEWLELQLYAHTSADVIISEEEKGNYVEGESYDDDPEEEHPVGEPFRIQIKGK